MVIETYFGSIIVHEKPKVQKISEVGTNLKMSRINSKLEEIKDKIKEGTNKCRNLENPASCYKEANELIIQFLNDRSNFPGYSDLEYNINMARLNNGKENNLTPIGVLGLFYPLTPEDKIYFRKKAERENI